jgi:hypothetical protein
VLHERRDDQHDPVVLVVDVHARLRVLDVDPKLDQHPQRDLRALGDGGHILAVLVLDPDLRHLGVAVPDVAVAGGHRLRVAPEVELEVLVRDVLRVADVDHPPLLEQHRAVAEALHADHVVRHEQDRLALIAHPVEDVEALLLERRVADG